MVKWLRKHNKQLMVGVVLFAMFSFVGGSALVTMVSPDPGSQDFALVFGEKIKNSALYGSQNDMQILEATGQTIRGFHPDMRAEHWYMLIREAEDAGIVIPDATVEAYLQIRGLTVDTLADFPQKKLFSYPSVRRTYRRFLAVQTLGRRVASTTTPSETQMRHYVRDTQEKVVVEFVALDAPSFVDADEPVDAADMQAHFDRHKDVDPAQSDDGYGYKYPRRVRVQYLGAKFDQVAPHMEVTEPEVKAYWRKNRAKYRITETVEVPIPATTQPAASQPATTQPSSTSQPTTSQAAPATRTERREREKRFSEARSQVEGELRARRARQRVEQAMRAAATQLLKPWQDQTIDPETGYKLNIPSAAKEPNHMRRIRDEMATKFDVPLDYQETGLTSQAGLSSLPTIGMSNVPISRNQQLSFAEYAFRVPAFFEKERGSETTLSLQLFQTADAPLVEVGLAFENGQFFQTTKGMYLFRVIEAREAEAPASLDEVRLQVEADIRKERAFHRMEADAKELYAVARRLGVGQALTMMDELRTKSGVSVATRPPAFAKRTPLDPQRPAPPALELPTVSGINAKSEEFIDACFEMAADDWTAPEMQLPTTPNVEAATTRPAKVPAPKVRLVSLPKLKKWVVLEFVEFQPVYRDKYEQQFRSQAMTTLSQSRLFEILQKGWFNPVKIELRCGFERIFPDRESDDPDEAAAS